MHFLKMHLCTRGPDGINTSLNKSNLEIVVQKKRRETHQMMIIDDVFCVA